MDDSKTEDPKTSDELKLIALKQTRLWKAFADKATIHQQGMVESLISRVYDRLDTVRDTFPTYTLHNHTHALNVVLRMGDLLLSRIDSLSALEGAILLLSAYLHDVGMAFTEKERQNLTQQEDFERFLREYPQAYVTLQEHKPTIPLEVAEHYCRWAHARRVHGYLDGLEDSAITWGVTPLRTTLGSVCESHFWDVVELQRSTELPIDFRGEADLLFCAIILRLADILDFDNTRTPDEVYRYLGIQNRDTPRKEASDIEWNKHLRSEGFRFPDNRSGSYELKFIASPNNPAVENDVREFLNTIEAEITNCYSLLRRCAPIWQSFDLPGRINRDDIHSDGYEFGNYRFTLEQEQILNLLMGENLYSDPYVFVRELIQNAIDTTRHRVFYEKNSRGNAHFQPQPITVSTWHDKDGYQWVRIDDYGMGMNEDLIASYLLKVGKSYYQSAQFKAEILRYRSRENFVPISRFGIGLLSCFIVGDQLELSTRRYDAEKNQAASLRLSMFGLQSFFTLCMEEKRHLATPMPNERGKAETYRHGTDYGTSIAIRLDPRKEHARFDLKEILERYVLCSPVPIHYKGKLVGGDYQRLIATPWLAQPIEAEFTSEQLEQIEQILDLKFTEPPKIRIVPLDLTKHALTPELTGQAVVGYISLSQADTERLRGSGGISRNVQLNLDEKFNLIAKFDYRNNDKLQRIQSTYYHSSYSSYNDIRRYLDEEKYDVSNELERYDWQLPELFQDALRETDQVTTERPFELTVWREFERYCKKKLQGLDSDSRQTLERAFEKAKDFYSKHADFKKETLEAERKIQFDISYILNGTGLQALVPRWDTDSEQEIYWLSHNGVHIPTGAISDYDDPSFELDPPIANSWFRYRVALCDSLRPDVSLSREALRSVSWSICSQAALALFKAFRAYDEGTLYNQEIFAYLPEQTRFSLAEVLNDPNMDPQGSWAQVSMIATGNGLMSLEKIRQGVTEEKSFTLNLPDSDSTEFHECCILSLVQVGLDVRLQVISGYGRSYRVASSAIPVVSEGLRLFSPLFFVPYEGSEALKVGYAPYNLNHPFARWLVDNALILSKQFAGLFESIRANLPMGYISDDDLEKQIEVINKALARLRRLNIGISPGTDLDLKVEDFDM